MSIDAHRGNASTVRVVPIQEDDVTRVSEFLHANLNGRVSSAEWSAIVRPPWDHRGPNRGFRLVDAEDTTVGVYVAVYSTRLLHGVERTVCNLAAFAVLEPYRAHSLLLVRALTRQRGLIFTDLSPSGNVPALNERLGFSRLDTTTTLSINAPWRSAPSVSDDVDEIAATLVGDDARIFADHRAARGAHHLIVRPSSGRGYAYLMYRRDRRKRMRAFASPVYVGGDVATLHIHWRSVSAHLLARGLPLTLAEHRVLGFTPPGPGRLLKSPRAKMFKGTGLDAAAIDYLYSELTLVEW